MIQQAALVALGGAIGAVLRFGIGNIIESSEFPLSTIIVNVSGSFILGMLAVMAINNGYSEELMLFCGMGIGYADEDDPINTFRSKRVDIEDFTDFIGF